MTRRKELQLSRKVSAASLFVSLAFILSTPARADPGLQTMVYEVYTGGLHAVQAQLDIDYRKPGRYDIVLDAHTRGFLGKLVPWQGTFETHGWDKGEELKPELHKSTAIWQNEPDIKEYLYGADGSFKSLKSTDDKVKDHIEDVPDELTQGTIDAMTAALLVMEKIAVDGKCEGESEVFDGKRRFKQVFVHQAAPYLQASRYNVYSGDSVECTVEVVPVAGEWHSKPRGWMSIQEQGRAKGTMPTVWFARLEENGPAVPVKIRVKTDYGTLFMHLAEYRAAGEIISAETRMEPEEPEEEEQ
jgi:hypothetical protein